MCVVREEVWGHHSKTMVIATPPRPCTTPQTQDNAFPPLSNKTRTSISRSSSMSSKSSSSSSLSRLLRPPPCSRRKRLLRGDDRHRIGLRADGRGSVQSIDRSVCAPLHRSYNHNQPTRRTALRPPPTASASAVGACPHCRHCCGRVSASGSGRGCAAAGCVCCSCDACV